MNLAAALMSFMIASSPAAAAEQQVSIAGPQGPLAATLRSAGEGAPIVDSSMPLAAGISEAIAEFVSAASK